MINSLVFDVGNVLVKVQNKFIIRDISRTLGLQEKLVSTIWRKLIPELGRGAIDEGQFWDSFFKVISQPKQNIPKDILVREYVNRFKINDEVFAILKNLSQNKYKLGVVSNTIPSHAELIRDQGVFNIFEKVILSCDVGFRAPDRRMYYLALERLDAKKELTVFIDDIEEHVIQLQKIGLNAIVFNSPDQLRTDLERLGVNCQPPNEVKETNIGVHAILVTEDGNLILQRRSKHDYIQNPGKISFFGGTIRKNEKLLEGLERELYEELSYKYNKKDLFKLGTYYKTKEMDGIDHTSHIYVIKNVDKNSLILSEGKEFVIDTIDNLLTNKDTTRIANLALKDYKVTFERRSNVKNDV